MFDFLVVGCGFAGITASRILAEKGHKVLIADKRNHIGGNIYDYYNEDGILIHKYGPHIFHTNKEEVWKFLSRFTIWREYQHKVLSYVNGILVPMPINLNTINMLYNTNYDSISINDFFNTVKVNVEEFNNSKDVIVSQVGEELYKLFFEGYTKKQWDMYPYELGKEVTSRVPTRHNRDPRYFTDKYQGMPKHGYTKMVENILEHKNIKVMLNTEYKEIKEEVKYSKIIFTGCIDEFFEEKYGKLPYRSLNFIEETFDKEYYQPVGVVNYPNDYDYTRITEYKYLTGQKNDKTTIMKEISSATGEPYYPIPKPENKKLYSLYKKEAEDAKDVYFLGRLGTYSYMNMDAVVLQALELCENL
ncbi:UDP-galactopyranose mutase [Clostridium beijerinckii]|uniref:UDP-galactopyranose mutase n=1 Tax=Clostridium beijerinckii TaxID=1520 RepID=A0A1S8S901_CLOBE|nr:UDP-galactopyranose mutase [Clostridium beijerinckii]NRY60040.1 UDP-galactopyranose mutase [Clostridium beijerinckii]OOM61792.1 UDP-galactopyranose mutase precursor [Clostridium beijerinckii]